VEKANAIRSIAVTIQEKYGGQLPADYQALCSFPMSSQKVATITLQEIFNYNVGIGVDVHVKRISYANDGDGEDAGERVDDPVDVPAQGLLTLAAAAGSEL